VGIKRTNIQKPPAIELTESASGKKSSKKGDKTKPAEAKTKKKYTKL
jgi:hypothetical protein